jgi:signal transduction histidine kinase
VAIGNARLLERSRELSVIEERNRLARDLHDAVSQTLFSLTLTAEAASQLAERDLEAAKVQMAKVSGLAQEVLDEMRSLVFQLRPADLDAEGLVPTLGKHVEVVRRASGKHIDLVAADVPGLDPEIELGLFRIFQEALHNAVRHSGADRIEVEVRSDDGTVTCRVSDDGRGFKPRAPEVRAKHLGLTSMQERAREVGGSLRIDSSPGAGTTVEVEVRF